MENTKNIINFIYQNNTISQNKFGIIESLKNPIAAQEKAFFNLIKNIKDTAIYKELKLDKIKNHYELIKKVPLHDYNFYEKFINKIIAGEENQMFIGKPKYFFSSSGTTNNSKTIPCSNEIFSVFNQSLTEYLLYLYQNLNDISLESDSISIGAKHTIEEINGVQKGYLSGILATSSSRINKYPSPEYFQIDNYSERISKIYFEAKDKDIKLITGVPAHIFAFFNEILNLSGKQKIQEI
ncbi:GH3 family domain-containing protein [Silvanigrella aquatica]|uniref:Acyl-protein synthetase LuxE domain-containing protein n=1 Tax=Silvanigrella aquatica TaxID=1915309 RepID=A0A1L4D2K9_9BACT|nr:GH3 auxin-responsive promoter family protein [Silvanigrella aquatica]APJ04445.1 hypothetical protein AXG55_11210 [Silvanigrella aquatica]